MASANQVTEQLKVLPTVELNRLFREGGLPSFTEYTVETVAKVIEKELDDHKKSKRESNIAKTGMFILNEEDNGINWKTLDKCIEAVEQVLREYLAGVNWMVSQMQVIGGRKQATYLASSVIYQRIRNKKVLARPVEFGELLSYLYISKEVKGLTGLLLYNLEGDDTLTIQQRVDKEVMRAMFFKTKPEGRYLYGLNVKSKQEYLNDTYTYSEPRETLKRTPKDEDNINYIAYLTQVFGYRNTNILAEKTQTFLGVLAEYDKAVFDKLKTDAMFRGTRIFEKDGYTLILRSRFVLIDNIRNRVIINKTPTNMAKKDIELLVRLLVNN